MVALHTDVHVVYGAPMEAHDDGTGMVQVGGGAGHCCEMAVHWAEVQMSAHEADLTGSVQS